MAAPIGAQENPVAYPQDTVTFTSGNVAPFGSVPMPLPNADEGRWQQLIPATHLPTVAGNITSLGVMSLLSSGTQAYPLLRITLSHTNATSLQSNFANNLPSPVVVLEGANLTIDWVVQSWVTVGFDVPFAHDGVGNLVIEVQKITTTSSFLSAATATANPGRGDLPSAVVASGPAGSGAWNAAIGIGSILPLQMRLYTDTAPTLVLRSNRQGNGNVFAIGGPLDVIIHATPGSTFCSYLDAGFSPRYTLPIARGAGVVMPMLEIGVGMVTSTPAVTRHMILPDPALINLHAAFQAAVLEPGASLVAFTNGADAIVRP